MNPLLSLPVVSSPVVWAAITSVAIVVVGGPRPRPRSPIDPPAGSDDALPAVPRPPRRNDHAVALAHWCESVARGVRSGASLAEAAAATPAPHGAGQLDAVGIALRRSTPLPGADHGDRDLTLVLGVLAACAEQGGPVAEPLDRAAAVLRARASEAAERATQSAQARLSARVMTALPGVMLAVMLVSSASVRAVVVTPGGLGALAVGVALNIAGWRWLGRLLRRAAA